ncbi:MAG: 50S ribosomal protein L32 [Firmicutes bacterium]|nr:50S ribosomal protein L32 [Bacillota bacterium]
MGVPKRRRSKSKTSQRRSSMKATAPSLVECPQCHELTVPHRLCPKCGQYNGRQVQEV